MPSSGVRTGKAHLEVPTQSVPGGFPGATQMYAGIAQRLQAAGEKPRQVCFLMVTWLPDLIHPSLFYKCFHQQLCIYYRVDRSLALKGNAFTKGEWQFKTFSEVWREEKLFASTIHPCPISWLELPACQHHPPFKEKQRPFKGIWQGFMKSNTAISFLIQRVRRNKGFLHQFQLPRYILLDSTWQKKGNSFGILWFS